MPEPVSISPWRRFRAKVRWSRYSRLRLIDGRLGYLAVDAGPGFVVCSDGMLLQHRPRLGVDLRNELRTWDEEWSVALRPLRLERHGAEVRLELRGPAGSGHVGRLAGGWRVGYADTVVMLIDALRSSPRARAGLDDEARVRDVLMLFDGSSLGWPVRPASRARVVREVLAVLRDEPLDG